jgi:uncharacterized protein with gpF-like domain
MPERPSRKDLNSLIAQLRRVSDHREKGAEKEIRRIYQLLLKDLRAFLGEKYAQLAEDDSLTYDVLQQKGEYARFMEEIVQRIDSIAPEASKEIQKIVEDTYKTAYSGMVEAVNKTSDASGLQAVFSGVQGTTPEIVRRAVQNPISGLTLSDTLERHRNQIVYNIKQQIGIGLTNGDRYTTMARRISKEVGNNYTKAMCITRTESHRVREAGLHDSATNVNSALQQAKTGYQMVKTWRTMKDERVRPQVRVKRKGKFIIKTRIGAANHVKMEGVTVPVDAEFRLAPGVTTKAPGQSGIAGQDINCRCFLEYSLQKTEEAT